MLPSWRLAMFSVFFWACSAAAIRINGVLPRDDANPTFHPAVYALAKAPSSNVKTFESFELSLTNPVATLDYGHEVAGLPIFDVKSLTGRVQIEAKYSEEYAGLNAVHADGPFPFAAVLANTYRVETFEITSPGLFEAFFLQGGQRWQSIRLLTNGTVFFSSVGLKASISTTDVDNLPGSFSSDIELLDKIWKLGARAASAACVEAKTQPAMWQVSEKGAFVRGMRSAVSVKGAEFKDYTMEHDVFIERAGTSWSVAWPIELSSIGIQLDLVGDLPATSTFVNTNTSLTPPNTIILGYGYTFVNQTTITSYFLDTFQIPFSVYEKTWYSIKTVLSGGKYLSVSLNGTQIFNTSLSQYYVGGSSIPTAGSFGFGGWQDQSSYVSNVKLYDTANGTLLYSNSMTNVSLLGEFGVHENYDSLCLDGAKRDRLGWLGDLIHTTEIIAASTSRYDILKSTLQWFLDWQTADGLIPFAAPPMGYESVVASEAWSGGSEVDLYAVALIDYQILGVITFCNYIEKSNDLAFASSTWTQWKMQVDWILSQIDNTTGLVSFSGFTILGPAVGGSASSCSLVKALHQFANVATAINKTASASHYLAVSKNLTKAIQTHLWNDELGIFSLSPASLEDCSVAGLSFCLSSGVANTTQANRIISALSNLKLGPGYKDSTQVNSSDPTVNISPFTNGLLLSALMSQNTTKANVLSLELMKTLWGSMLANNLTSSGASWEYVNQEGNPGLGLFTSLSHPWGGAPTYLLTAWVAGLRPVEGVQGYGYGYWVVDPSVGLQMGLKRARARVVTAFGGSLGVWWSVSVNGRNLEVVVEAPVGTTGTVMGMSIEGLGIRGREGGRVVYNVTVALP